MERRKVFESVKKAITIVLAAAIIFTLSNPLQVQAAKKVTLKSYTKDYTVSQIKKASTTLKKGTYNIRIKQFGGGAYRGYIKFVAPKAGTYSFTFSNCKTDDKKHILGSAFVQTPDKFGGLGGIIEFSTKGGKTNTLWMGSKKDPSYPECITTRTGKVKLKKGQNIYLHVSFETREKSNKGMSLKLVIK